MSKPDPFFDPEAGAAWDKECEHQRVPSNPQAFSHGYVVARGKYQLLNDINFWKRLEMFMSDVQVNDPMSEEEQVMIFNICKEFKQPK